MGSQVSLACTQAKMVHKEGQYAYGYVHTGFYEVLRATALVHQHFLRLAVLHACTCSLQAV